MEDNRCFRALSFPQPLAPYAFCLSPYALRLLPFTLRLLPYFVQKHQKVVLLNKNQDDNNQGFSDDLYGINLVTVKDQFYRVITILATIAYFIPVLIVIFKKLWKDLCFLYLGLYWLAGAIVNILTNVPGTSLRTLEIITVLYNMVDIPLILWILWYTSFSSQLAKFLKLVIIGYVLVECILVFQMGLNYDAIKYIIGAGVLVVLVTLIWEITIYFQRIEHSNREKAMLFIYAALLFEYGSYTIVYVFDYFIIPADEVDKLLIYYISTLVAIMIASFGFLLKKTKKSMALR